MIRNIIHTAIFVLTRVPVKAQTDIKQANLSGSLMSPEEVIGKMLEI